MKTKSRSTSEELVIALESLQKEEEKIDKTREPVISTALTQSIFSILTVMVQYKRLREFVDQVPARDGWRLDCPYENTGYYGVHTVRYQDMLWGALSETEKIVLALHGKVWELNLKAENLGGIVKAISTLPQIIGLWRAEVERKKAELARRQAEWDAKRERVEEELVQTEQELKALCQELITVSRDILENKGD